MSKFLPAIIFIQLVTSSLVLMAINWSYDIQLLIVIIAIAFISAILFAFWLSSISQNIFNDKQTELLKRHAQDRENILKEFEREKATVIKQQSNLQNQHARERERILLDAERDKARITEESYRKIDNESRKAHRKANIKVGLAFTAVVGAGGVMIISQLVTVGVMVMVSAGSGLSGYILRARQESASRKKQLEANDRIKLTQQSNLLAPQKWLSKDKSKS